mmetsp:Transcript_6308/g.8341  ORF Transcript_6308/g.8341 Transcript_6308/m.8341 type:complete len:139 (+) Transcript_6308:99-515(+)
MLYRAQLITTASTPFSITKYSCRFVVSIEKNKDLHSALYYGVCRKLSARACCPCIFRDIICLHYLQTGKELVTRSKQEEITPTKLFDPKITLFKIMYSPFFDVTNLNIFERLTLTLSTMPTMTNMIRSTYLFHHLHQT